MTSILNQSFSKDKFKLGFIRIKIEYYNYAFNLKLDSEMLKISEVLNPIFTSVRNHLEYYKTRTKSCP